ncbi:MAG: trigger factor [Alistipes sp.]|nr:trigger factor [Alistipes sp.]
MNIVRENLEDRTTLLKVTVGEADYNEAVDKSLRTYKRKANIPGFRPGMVPMAIVNKMYRKGVVAEESYRTASKACFDYIEKEKITTVGDMIPSNRQGELDFDNNTEYEFIFEVGVAPEVKLDLTKKDKVTKYAIQVEEKMRDGYRSNFTNRFGKLEEVESVAKDEALDVTLEQGETKIDEAYVGLVGMSDEERAPFIGKKVGDSMDVDLTKLYKTASQRASILGVKEEELEGMDPNYKLTVTKIRRFVAPELNDDFFKLAFPDGSVTTAEGLEQYIDGQIARDLGRETDFLFGMDMKKFLLKKADLEMPEAFLKNWLFTINEGKFSMEDIEKDFAQFLDMMRWNLIEKHYVNEFKLEVSEAEALEEAKKAAAAQFAYYGIPNVDDETLTKYAQNILGNKEENRKLYDKLFEEKVIAAVVPQITVSEKSISTEDFGKLAQEAR